MTDSTGTLTSQQRYLPFGGVRSDVNDITQTDYGYTGQRALDSGMGGLMDYRARFYSPLLNRFIQPDSIVPSPANPQSLNRFSYVYNNPIRYNDPSGHVCSDPENTVNGFCEGSAHVTTLVGNRVVAGNGKSGGASCGRFGQPKCRTNKQADAPQLNPRSTATPTVTPSPTNTPCLQAFICGLPTTSTPTVMSTQWQPFGQGPVAQTAVNFFASEALTSVAIVDEGCLEEGGTCGKDFIQPLVSSYTYSYPFTGLVVDATVAIDRANKKVADGFINVVLDMEEGWQNSTPSQRNRAVVVGLVTFFIVFPGFIPP